MLHDRAKKNKKCKRVQNWAIPSRTQICIVANKGPQMGLESNQNIGVVSSTWGECMRQNKTKYLGAQISLRGTSYLRHFALHYSHCIVGESERELWLQRHLAFHTSHHYSHTSRAHQVHLATHQRTYACIHHITTMIYLSLQKAQMNLSKTTLAHINIMHLGTPNSKPSIQG